MIFFRFKEVNKNHFTRQFLVFALIFANILAFCGSNIAFADASIAKLRTNVLVSNFVSKPLAPGTILTRYNELTSSGMSQYSVLAIDLDEPSIMVSPHLANDVLTSPATNTTIAKANDLIASVNADFFEIGYSNAPYSTLVQDGEIIRSPRVNDHDFSTLCIFEDTADFFPNLTWSGKLLSPYNFSLNIIGYNDNVIPNEGCVIFDDSWPIGSHSGSWLTDSIGTTIITIDKDGYVVSVKKSPIKSQDLVKKDYSAGVMIADESNMPVNRVIYPIYELVCRGNAAKQAAKLYVGDKVSLSFEFSPALESLETAFSGKPMLLTDGTINPSLASDYGTIQGNSRAPRTAVGLDKAKKTLYFVVVDGRTAGAIGMTLKELAFLMSDLGCYNALNLDGGGSSAIVYKSDTSKYSLASRLSESERKLPYTIGISYANKEAMCGVPSSIQLSASVRKNSTSSYMPVSIPKDFDIAISGGASAFIQHEVLLQNGYEMLIEAKVLDVFGNLVSLGESTGYNVMWNTSGVVAENVVSSTLSISSLDPGKIAIKAQVVMDGPQSESSSTYLPYTFLNVRNTGNVGFMQLDPVNKNVKKDEKVSLALAFYDEYGYKLPYTPKNIEIKLVTDGVATYLNTLEIPCSYFTSSSESSLVIKCDDLVLRAQAKTLGNTTASGYETGYLSVSETSLEKNSVAISKTRFNTANIPAVSSKPLIIDTSNGGISATDSKSWQRIVDYLNSGAKNLEIVLKGNYAISQSGKYDDFKDSTEAELLFKILSTASNASNLNMTLRQRGTATGWIMMDGVRCVYEK